MEEEVKEDCDKMSALEILDRVKELCTENNIPSTGWNVYFYNSPGPKCLKRYSDGEKTHTAYVHSFWIDIYLPGGIEPIIHGGLA